MGYCGKVNGERESGLCDQRAGGRTQKNMYTTTSKRVKGKRGKAKLKIEAELKNPEKVEGRGKNLPFSGVHRLSLYLPSQQGSTTLSLILLSILSVSILHSALTSHLSYFAGKGEEL